MKEQCRMVQEAVSRAADGDNVTAEEAARAKRHCASCADCAQFVSTLAALRRTPPPMAPPATVQRALDAVRAEARAAAAAAQAAADERVRAEADAAAAAAAADTAAGRGAAAEPSAPGAPVLEMPRRRPVRPAAVAGWLAGAAALLFVTMFVTAQGLNYMAGDESAFDGRASAPSAESGPALTAPVPGEMAAEDAAGDADSSAASSAETGVSYVAYDGFAYRLVSQIDIDPDDLPLLGTLTSALDTGEAPRSFSVYQGDTDDRIVVDQDGIALSFELVVRDFGGERFGLRCDTVAAFGEWPSPPAGIEQPSEPDGSPTFEPAGEEGGITVYTESGEDPEDGFAVPPGTGKPDPAAGNPNWTWWEPLP